MSNSILKSNWVVCKPGDTRIIDSNGLLEEKLKNQAGSIFASAPETEDGFVPGIFGQEYEQVDFPEESFGEPAAEESFNPTREAEEILLEAKAQVEELKQQALQEIELERQRAIEEGRQQGYEAGYNEGFMTGSEEGRQQGLQELEAQKQEMLQELALKTAQHEHDFKEKIESLEPKLVETITGIYEKVFQVELKNRKDIVIRLLENTVKNLEGIKSFLIHVSKEDYPLVSMQKKEITKGTNIAQENVDIIEDSTLAHGECMIETDNGIFDCSFGTQLELLNDQLTILSYKSDNTETAERN